MNLLIVNANEIITMANEIDGPRKKEAMKEIGVQQHASILVVEGRVAGVAPLEELRAEFPHLIDNAKLIDASGQTVMPGLVDCHTHLVHGGTREDEFHMQLEGRAYRDIMEAGGGIHTTMRKTRETSFEELYEKAYKQLNNFLKHGVTTVEAKSGYGMDWENEKKLLEVTKALQEAHPIDIASTFMGAHAVPVEYKGKEEKFVDELIEYMLPQVAKGRLAEFNDVFYEKGVFTPNQARRILEAGKEFSLIPKIHADVWESYGGAELAAEVGVISAEHLLATSDKGIKAMAKAGVTAVLLPGNAFFCRVPYARGRYMIDVGVPVAISTGFNPGSSPTMSLPFIQNIACLNMSMTMEEVLTAATINAAYAINRGKEIGSLERGKRADILILDVENYKQLQYFYGMNHTNTVIKDGNIVVRDGHLVL